MCIIQLVEDWDEVVEKLVRQWKVGPNRLGAYTWRCFSHEKSVEVNTNLPNWRHNTSSSSVGVMPCQVAEVLNPCQVAEPFRVVWVAATPTYVARLGTPVQQLLAVKGQTHNLRHGYPGLPRCRHRHRRYKTSFDTWRKKCAANFSVPF
jgi:hypothetical protein